jgi:hypothetical protein
MILQAKRNDYILCHVIFYLPSLISSYICVMCEWMVTRCEDMNQVAYSNDKVFKNVET